MKRLVPNGYVLIIEKDEPHRVTENQTDGTQFLSRAREVAIYEGYMAPYKIVKIWDRKVEPTYSNPQPGKCMLFKK